MEEMQQRRRMKRESERGEMGATLAGLGTKGNVHFSQNREAALLTASINLN